MSAPAVVRYGPATRPVRGTEAARGDGRAAGGRRPARRLLASGVRRGAGPAARSGPGAGGLRRRRGRVPPGRRRRRLAGDVRRRRGRARRLPDLPEAERLDLGAVTVVGHSAGGHLAAWAAGRHRLPGGAPGAGTAGAPGGRRCCRPASWIWSAPTSRGWATAPSASSSARARTRRRTGTLRPTRSACCPPVPPCCCVHGAADATVVPSQSERYAEAAAAAGDRVELRVVPGDHMALIDPAGRGGGWSGTG